MTSTTRTLLRLFAQGGLNGATHTCLGQAYVPVALRPLLDEEDVVNLGRAYDHRFVNGRDAVLFL